MHQRKFTVALADEIDRLRWDYGEVGVAANSSDKVASKINHLVFVMHGIRDVGEWTIPLASLMNRDARTRAITAKYDYFAMGPFLLFEDRQTNVRWFMDQYTEAIAEYPSVLKKAEDGMGVSFVGHSNGTYLLASALQHYRTIEFNRVAFAGSVVPRKFPWDRFMREGRVQAIRNDLANKDWVVAIFPGFFEQFYRLTGIGLFDDGDIGTGGFYGFEDYRANTNDAYYEGGHSAAIKEGNFASLVKVLIHGETERPPELLATGETPDSLVGWLNKLAWLELPLLVVCLYLVGRLAVKRSVSTTLRHRPSAFSEHPR